MEYTGEFVKKVNARVQAFADNLTEGYSMTVEKGGAEAELGLPPIFELVRYLREIGQKSFEEYEAVLRHAITGRSVKVFFQGKLIANFQLNSLTDNFDLTPLANYPTAVLWLENVAYANLLGKSMPLQERAPQAAAGKGTEGPAGLSTRKLATT